MLNGTYCPGCGAVETGGGYCDACEDAGIDALEGGGGSYHDASDCSSDIDWHSSDDFWYDDGGAPELDDDNNVIE